MADSCFFNIRKNLSLLFILKGDGMLTKYRLFLSVVILAYFSSVMAADQSFIKLPEGLVVHPHMYGHFQAGQIAKGSLMPQNIPLIMGPSGGAYNIKDVWVEDAIVECGFAAVYRERLKLDFTLGTKLYFSYPQMEKERYTKNLRQDVFLGDLYAQYHFGDKEMPLFLGQVGYFRLKYNANGRNFGDYLFRTGTYPIWFDMSFDAPWQRLLGLHMQSNIFQSLKLDALLISSTVAPAMNWSLAFLANYDIARLHFINIGAGIDWANLFSVYSKKYSYYFGGDPTTPESDINCKYVTDTGDTAYYTFKGTKVMAQISIDPKALFPRKAIFGENDFRLYAEVDIIGIKSYPDSGITAGGQKQLVAPSYNNIWEKMPVAIGFNFPTFKLLDVLNFELEWFGAKYYNDASNQINYGSAPLPMNVQYFGDTLYAPKKGYLKWSVYAKRSFLNGHCAIIAQVARDHMRTPCAAYNYEMWNELLVSSKDWGWYLKTSWNF